jgi:PST family polysaccharide transporter
MSLADKLLAYFLPGGAEGVSIRRNAGWLLADRLFRLVVGLGINVWIVRSLGAANLGLLGFAQSLVGLIGIISYLGLESIVVRELVRRPGEDGEILGTAATMRGLGASLTLALSGAAMTLLRPGDSTAITLALILGGAVMFQALDVIDHWFQSRSDFLPFVLARAAAFVLAAGVKVACLIAGASLEALTLAIAGEFALAATMLLVAYRRAGGALSRWRFDPERARILLAQSWPLMLTTAAIVIYTRTDQVMLTLMRGESENGIYAAAQRLSEILYFIPVAALAAANPTLLRTHQQAPEAYRRRLGRLFGVLTWIAIGLAVPISLGAGVITRLLFGAEFAGSGPVLALHVWAAPAVFLGVAQSNWFIAEGKERGLLLRAAAGAGANVALNLWLIPRFGAVGAAIATLASQWIASFFLNALFGSTRALFRLQCRSFLPVFQR